jgi:hypothetical protein
VYGVLICVVVEPGSLLAECQNEVAEEHLRRGGTLYAPKELEHYPKTGRSNFAYAWQSNSAAISALSSREKECRDCLGVDSAFKLV